MAVKKEKNGTWTVYYYYKDCDGKRHHTTKRGFKTKKEAAKWENKDKLPASCHMFFSEFVELYKEDKKHELKERTMMMKDDVTKKHILPFFRNMRMDEITSQDVMKWKNQIKEKGYSSSYERTIDNQLSAYFNHASVHYGLPNNPCKKVKKMGAYKNRNDFLTFEEYERFIAMYEPGSRQHVLFNTLAFTGMRCGECLALTPADIDIANRTISITKTYYRRNGMDYITSPKTEESNRIIHIPQFLADELQDYMNRIFGLEKDQRIFPIVHEAVQHTMKNMLKKAGVRHVPVHSWRHFFASYLISLGVDALTLKEMLGHKDIKITLNTYSHLMPNKQQEVVNLLDQKMKEQNGEGDER